MQLMAINPSKEHIRTGHIQLERYKMLFWLMRLTRFREGKPIPKEFKDKLLQHLNHFLLKDRIHMIEEGDLFLNILPRPLKKAILIGYIYDDVFSDFRKFFRPQDYMNTSLLESLAYRLKTRFIHGSKQE